MAMNEPTTIEEIRERSKALTKAMAALVAERHRIWQRWRAGKSTPADVVRDKAAETERGILRRERDGLSVKLRRIRAAEKNEKQRAAALGKQR